MCSARLQECNIIVVVAIKINNGINVIWIVLECLLVLRRLFITSIQLFV